MKVGLLAICAAIVSAAAPLSAVAWPDTKRSPSAIADQIFAYADADKDGAMTREEYASGGLGKYGAKFAAFDLNRDGRVTRAEYREVFARFHSGVGGQAI